jgi:purine nucleosidase
LRRPVLFDTDIGSDADDALALGLILACPEEIDLVAVTTVTRDTQLRARIAAFLLGLAGRSDVDVCAGEVVPLLRSESVFVWFGHETRCPSASDAAVCPEAAPERIVRAAREVEGLEVVAVGPLTNLARALELDPELPKRVAGLTVMGGHIRRVAIGGHVCAPGIDYNLCSDREAIAAVLGAGFQTTLVPADVTLETWIREHDLEKLSAAGPVARALADEVRLWTPVQHRIFTAMGGTLAEDNVAFLHDPLTVLALVDPAPLGFEELRVVPTIESGVFRTLEVEPGLGFGAAMRVATSVDAEAARNAIMERLLRAGARDPRAVDESA